jgi:hypothetical protein
MNAGLRNRAINTLALSPNGLLLFAGTEGNGVYRLALPGPYAGPLGDPVDERPVRVFP